MTAPRTDASHHVTRTPSPEGTLPEQAGQDQRVTLTVAATFFMLLLDGTILNTSLPRMAEDLHVSPGAQRIDHGLPSHGSCGVADGLLAR